MLTAVVGINWGDEGKGRMVDLLSEGYDIICRYQGGNNAGHTVINDKGKFILNLLPSGILRENTVNVMGAGMVIDLEHLAGELATLTSQGVEITPANLKISDKAFICMPYHKAQDILEEERLADKKYGSTKRGIAPVYGDKYMKKGLRLGDLLHRETLEEKLRDILEWKNITLEGYNSTSSAELPALMAWLEKFGGGLLPHITDTTEFLLTAANSAKKIMFEAQLGALRDIDFGIYPYTTSSQTLAAYATIGAGIPGKKLDRVVGVMKAYSSCVGEGPFTAEIFGAEAEALREAGGEYGAATGRPRRVGGFDIPASRYGIEMQGADELALTKLDVLSYMDKIPVCVAYEVDGVKTRGFPCGDNLAKAKPVYEYLTGFKVDISKCRSAAELPPEALNYIRYIEDAMDCPIKYVSVGAGREDYFKLG
ncbi:MAG: adenylosuccinate synthase [Defluviitaleaceae bacterium]|nr:adenylosuccinate synthase [Defluviitaleaceae bacterium]MCL2263917.1 adenylosuccinate synthase [Defluviitaleaceae bacterium]